MSEKILLEDKTRFQCVQDCGFCCRYWNVHIDPDRKEALSQKDWVQQKARDLLHQGHQELFNIIGQNEQPIIQRQQGICSFIDERKLCTIHAIEGAQAKPVEIGNEGHS